MAKPEINNRIDEIVELCRLCEKSGPAGSVERAKAYRDAWAIIVDFSENMAEDEYKKLVNRIHLESIYMEYTAGIYLDLIKPIEASAKD